MEEEKEKDKYEKPKFHKSQLNEWGRPREYDRTKIAQDLLLWAELDTSWNMNGFCGDQKMSPATFFRWLDEDPDFRESYEHAKTIVADRREKKLSSQELHVKAYDLNAAVYDRFLRRERRQEVEHAAKVKRIDDDNENQKIIMDLKAEVIKLQAKLLEKDKG